MTRINSVTLVIALGVCVAIGLPVAAAIGLAREESEERAESRALGLAQVALVQGEETGNQLAAATDAINRLPADRPCDREGVDLMRQIDLESTLLQAVGWADGNVMRCSSIGGSERLFDLGEPEMTSSLQARIRRNVVLLDPSDRYFVVQRGHGVAVIHQQLALSFVKDYPSMSVALFSKSKGEILMQRGDVPRRYLRSSQLPYETFRDGNRQIAIVRSPKYDIGAIVVQSNASFYSYVNRAALILISIGLIVGVFLSLLLIDGARRWTSWPALIRSGLKRGEFELHYQPVVRLEDEKIVGAEVLVRWSDRGNLRMSPDQFIPLAEDAGIITLITDKVLDLLVADAQAILKIDPKFHFAVNISSQDIHRADLAERLNFLIRRSGLDAGQIVVEVTERSVVDAERAEATLGLLRATGVKVAVDDFGTGYSSLASVAKMKLDLLKIDKLFVGAIGTNSEVGRVTNKIVDLAKHLHLGIIAEGIETREQAEALRSMGVEYGQGYYFARPMIPHDLLQKLRKQRDEG